MYPLSPYEFHIHMIDWKTVLERHGSWRVQQVTLSNNFSARQLLNTTGTEILFYESDVYRPMIHMRVVSEMRRIMKLTKEKYPTFQGKVSIAAHSLGSVILYDILKQQVVPTPDEIEKESENLSDLAEQIASEVKNLAELASEKPEVAGGVNTEELTKKLLENHQRESETKDVEICMFPEGLEEENKELQSELEDKVNSSSVDPDFFFQINRNKGVSVHSYICQPYDVPPEEDQDTVQLNFWVHKFFLLGSPLGCYSAVRHAKILPKLPTVEDFYSIFHPSDVVAYRVEPLVNDP